MLKQFLVVSSIATLPLINEYTKTHITRTNVFKKTIAQINKQLSEINITLDKPQQKIYPNQSQLIKLNSQQEILFDLILTPQIEKMLSKKSKHKIQLINKLKNQQNCIIKTNAYILGIHSLGSLTAPFFFYWSAIAYASFSQFSLLNDLYTLKTGNQFADLHPKNIGDIYLKVSAVVLLAFGMKNGIKKLAQLTQTKQIVRRDP